MRGVRRDPDLRSVRSAILRWARSCERPLPWRGESDPYRILVSEVMLQQTQASRVADAYEAFIRSFPTLDALAGSDLPDVLRAWDGLGYNRRALGLWRAARMISARETFPETVEELLGLPGVGPYTARAVASFAFGADEAVVDANVRRILTRMAGLPSDTDVQDAADRLLPPGRAADWNQALMDLGALVCRPRAPTCSACPVRQRCAWANGDRHHRPRRRAGQRFEDTTRYARGRVVAALRSEARGATAERLARTTGLGMRRTSDALVSLERDGLAGRSGRRWVLGGAGRQPKDARRSATSRIT